MNKDPRLKPALVACPAGIYTENEAGEVMVSEDGCLECGTCLVACGEEVLEWDYPDGGEGVQLWFGQDRRVGNNMKIITAMKQIPDLQQIRIKDRKPVLNDAPWIFGKIDKNALEAAVRIKEEVGGEVTVVSAGNEELQDTIKDALAADADSAVMVVDNVIDQMDSGWVARILAELVKKANGYDLIIFGEGSGDNYSGLMGSRVAELLDLPQVGSVSSIEVSNGVAVVKRSLENQDEIIEVALPAVLIVASDLNVPRIPSVTKVLKAGRKPKEVFKLNDLNIQPGVNQITTISNLAPLSNRKGVKLAGVDELLKVFNAEVAGGEG